MVCSMRSARAPEIASHVLHASMHVKASWMGEVKSLLPAMAASPVLLGTLRLKASDGLHHAAWFPALHVALACHSPVQTRDLARVGVCGVYRSTFEHDCLRT